MQMLLHTLTETLTQVIQWVAKKKKKEDLTATQSQALSNHTYGERPLPWNQLLALAHAGHCSSPRRNKKKTMNYLPIKTCNTHTHTWNCISNC